MNSLPGGVGLESVSFKLPEVSGASFEVLSFDERTCVPLRPRPGRLRKVDVLSFRKPVSLLGVPTACWLIRSSLQKIYLEMFGWMGS